MADKKNLQCSRTCSYYIYFDKSVIEKAFNWQHSKETKARYYKKVSYEEAQESYAKHHPAFVEEW